jgi:hypothetical protein
MYGLQRMAQLPVRGAAFLALKVSKHAAPPLGLPGAVR